MSSNARDAFSAKAFGFRVAWCNCFGQAPERIPEPRMGKSTRSVHYLKYSASHARQRALCDRASPKVGELAADFEIERLTPSGLVIDRRQRQDQADHSSCAM